MKYFRRQATTVQLVALCALLGIVPAGRAATIGICPPGTQFDADTRAQVFYSQAGEQQLLLISEEELDQRECETIQLPQSLDSVVWASVLPGASDLDPNHITLQGSFAPNAVAISEIIPSFPSPPSSNEAIPPPNPLPEYETLVFGIEERASWLDGKRLQCRAGQQAAGVQLRSRTTLPQNEQLHMLLSGEGEFELMIADAAGIQNESALSLGSLSLEPGSRGALARFDFPPNTSSWIAFTILCPETTATLSLDAIDFYPPMDSSLPERSAWVWHPSIWQQDPEFFWRLSALEDLQEFFITAPVNASGEVSASDQLRQFIREASTRGIRIWAVIGDRNDVLEENRGLLRTRVSAYRRFNNRAAEEEKLAGVQLDIEPYLLPGHNLGINIWRERYLQTIQAATDTAGASLPVDLVMPVWWGDHPSWGSDFLRRLSADNISITVVNYRTDALRLHAGAIPFLNWGSEQQRPVRMALETGSLTDETQRIYNANETSGRLWQMQLATTPILVLFNTPQQELEGRAYNQSEQREFRASNLTFGGDQQKLNALANELNEKWRRWPGFVGIALHGLDEIYSER